MCVQRRERGTRLVVVTMVTVMQLVVTVTSTVVMTVEMRMVAKITNAAQISQEERWRGGRLVPAGQQKGHRPGDAPQPPVLPLLPPSLGQHLASLWLVWVPLERKRRCEWSWLGPSQGTGQALPPREVGGGETRRHRKGAQQARAGVQQVGSALLACSWESAHSSTAQGGLSPDLARADHQTLLST